jgi:predicted lipoprotein with Yx(FWY)xxD motif
MKKLFSRGTALLALILLISSCRKNDTADVTFKNDINISTSATLGNYLVNKQGQALYMFANDADGVSSCAGACESLWPAATITLLSNATLDASLNAADFSVNITGNGKSQLTYKGWPLYTHSPAGAAGANVAEAPGETRGEGFNNLWFIAKPNYTITLANKQLIGLDGNNYKSDYTVGTGNTTYFTSATGRTVYTFKTDSFNINKFTLADLSNNAAFPMYEQEQIVVPSILDKALFGTITVAGKKQLTYKGWPLYFFGQDAARGTNKAVSAGAPGKWPVAVKDMAAAPRL